MDYDGVLSEWKRQNVRYINRNFHYVVPGYVIPFKNHIRLTYWKGSANTALGVFSILLRNYAHIRDYMKRF